MRNEERSSVLPLVFGIVGTLVVVGAAAVAGLWLLGARPVAPPVADEAAGAEGGPPGKEEPKKPRVKQKPSFPRVEPVEMRLAPLADESVELPLPGTVYDTCVGGGGRYWCLLLADLRVVAVFDANAARVTKYIPLATGNARIAAGMRKLVVAYPRLGTFVRYDLTTFELEAVVKSDVAANVKRLHLGAASAGPVFALSGGPTDDVSKEYFLDLATLEELDVPDVEQRPLGNYVGEWSHLRVSPDGRTYGFWDSNVIPSGFSSFVLSEEGAKYYCKHESVGYVIPSATGHLITYTGTFTADQETIKKKELEDKARIPAQQGDTYLAVLSQGSAAVRRERTEARVAFMDEIGLTLVPDGNSESDFTGDKRVLFTPANGLLAWLAPADNALRLYLYDPERDEKAFRVESRAPAAEAGKPYSYRLRVKKAKGAVAFKFTASPPGMTVGADGTLTWAVSADWPGNTPVALSLTDESGTAITHSFTLKRAEAIPPGIAGQDRAPAAEPPRFAIPAARPASVFPTKAADKTKIELPGKADYTCLGGNGRFILFRIPSKMVVAVLDVCEGKLLKEIPIAESNSMICATNEHLFMLSRKAGTFERWSLITFTRETSVPYKVGDGVAKLLAGHATDGPVMVVGHGNPLDPQTFKPVNAPRIVTAWNHGITSESSSTTRTLDAEVSADGRVFAWWSKNGHPSGFNGHVVSEYESGVYSEHIQGSDNLPGPDGTLFCGGPYTPKLFRLDQAKMGRTLPAAHGPYYLSMLAERIPMEDVPLAVTVTLRKLGQAEPIANLGQPEGFDLQAGEWGWGKQFSVPWRNRLFLIPRAEVLAALRLDATEVVLHRVSIEALMDKAKVDYLHFVSSPPGARRGATLRYKAEVKSSKGGVTFSLAVGPQGMSFAPDGTLTWNVPADFRDSYTPVILRATDSAGLEAFQAFVMPLPKQP